MMTDVDVVDIWREHTHSHLDPIDSARAVRQDCIIVWVIIMTKNMLLVDKKCRTVSVIDMRMGD